MGGVGKTQLALEYAYRHASEFDVVWWLRAEEPAILLADYAALARPLGLAQVGRGLAAVAQAVCAELARRDRWLLVFDNATGPKDVAPLLPRGSGGRVLITSRNPNWPAAVHLDVSVFDRAASVAFLLKRTGQGDGMAADTLAEALGDLPLALEQAAAYIAETGLSLAAYLDLFRTRQHELWREEKPPEGRSDTVGTTWTVVVERLRAEEPQAVALLNLCAFLAPEAIPRRLLVEHHGVLPRELGAAVADPLRLNRLVGTLRRYSLVEIKGEGLSVHRLVQSAIRDGLSDKKYRMWTEAAMKIMKEALMPRQERSSISRSGALAPIDDPIHTVASSNSPSDSAKQGISVFCSYSHEDERLKERLERQLQILQRVGFISIWHDRRIVPGQNWKLEIDEQLNSADLILLLVSDAFIASDYCWGREMARALERREAGQAEVVPVILRPVVWEGLAPFADLESLPAKGRAITEWSNRDRAFRDVTRGIQRVVESLNVVRRL